MGNCGMSLRVPRNTLENPTLVWILIQKLDLISASMNWSCPFEIIWDKMYFLNSCD